MTIGAAGAVQIRCGYPPELHVIDVEIDAQQRLVLTIESGQMEVALPDLRVLAMAVESACCTMRRASPGSPYEMARADLAVP